MSGSALRPRAKRARVCWGAKQSSAALPRPDRGRTLNTIDAALDAGMDARGRATQEQLPRGQAQISTRRQFVRGATLSAASLAAPGVFAQALATAVTGDGPYYPDRLPLDTDNDLLILNDGLTRAVGEIAHLTGRLFAQNGAPVRNAFIEIWQADVNGSYIHTEGRTTASSTRTSRAMADF